MVARFEREAQAAALVGSEHICEVLDMGELPDSLPVFLIPDIALNFETLRIILPYSLTLMVVGLAAIAIVF